MRSFKDSQGQPWQAALLDGSYGNILLVFSPLRGGEVRQQVMYAENLAAAEVQLAAMDEDGLRQALAEAAPWDTAATGP